MKTIHLLHVLAGAIGAVALTVVSAGAVAANDNHNPPCGSGCHEGDGSEIMTWLDYYEEDNETTYAQSANDVMAGPDGQGDFIGPGSGRRP